MGTTRHPKAGRRFPRSLCLILIAALTTAAAPAARAASPVSFLPPVNYEKPGAGDVTAVDLDGDGNLDLAVIGGGAISVLYGNGDGTFQGRADIPLGPGINDGQNQIIAADLDGDGRPDLVATIWGLQKIVVLMNQGHRTFGTAVSYTVGTAPTALTAGDFNGDGKLDLAVSNHLSNNMCVLLNQGDGSFRPAVFYPGGSYAARIVTADFNGDGKLDLAMSNYVSGNVLVYLGDAQGGFTVAGDYRTGGDYPGELITDDFNADGKPDLVAPNAYSASVSVLLGDGNGKFSVPILYAANDGAYISASTDLDGDGNPDLVVGNNLTNYFSVLQNTGKGSFLPPVRISSGGNNSRTVAIGDFNGDGRPDVAVGNLDSGTISVFLNSTPWPSPAIRFLTLDSGSVIGGCESASGTVTLSAPAPAGGAVIALASSNPAASVPAQVSIPEGALQAQFVVAAAATGAPQWTSLIASFNGTAKRASLLIRPMGVPQLTINPGQVIGGQPAMGHVTIACPAGPDGLGVLLSSSSPSVSVPASVTVPPGATTAVFPILTYKVSAATTVTITAGPPGAAATASLLLLPPAIPSPPPPPAPTPAPLTLVLFPNPVPGGLLALGQVTLAQPAGAGGALITLSSSSPAAVVVSPIAVPPGSSAATFPILTFPVSQPTPVTITATGAGSSATATLELLPLTAPLATTVRLLVSSHNSNSVLRFDGQTGAFVDTFVPPGSGGLEGPHALAMGPDGNLYVANRFHRSVLRYDGQTGAFIDAFVPPGSGGLDVPIGLAFGPDGNLYVSSYGTDQVLRYDGRTGAFRDVFVPARSAGLRQPHALLFGPDGNLYVCSQGANSVFEFDGRTGGFIDLLVAPGSGGLNGPNGLAFGPDGQLYVSSWQTHSILRYDARTGAFLGVFVPSHSGGLTEPWDLKFGPDGNLYVASAGTDQVLRYDGRTGAFLGPFALGGGLSRPDWLLFVPAAPGSPPPSVTPFLINGVTYAAAGPSETLAATFTRPEGGVTAASYKDFVLVHVTGVGQAYGATYNDAFYLYTAPFSAPQNGHDGGCYQLTYGTSPLRPFSLASNAENFLVGPLPAYSPAHDYTVILDTRLVSPGRLHFGVSDGGYNDNTGAYTITVTQLVASP